MLVLLLQACTEQKATVVEQKPLVVQLSSVKQSQHNEIFEFPATVSAVKSVDLKFEVSGRLIMENLVQGSEVKKGTVLARIDPAPFQRKVDENLTKHLDAEKALARIQEMHSRKLSSQRELDDAESQYILSKISLENAKQDLSYSTVTAPFDAVIGARYVENNSYIRAGDTVANLQDRSRLYFTFEVPERIMTANAGNRNIKATAVIIGREDATFDLSYVEHKTTPDPITQTYGVTFATNGEAPVMFYPGSRATVTAEILGANPNSLYIPLKSLVGDKASGFYVWRFNTKNSTVEKVTVEVVDILGQTAVIGGGLSTSDKVVSAAVNQMRSGLKVKEYHMDI